MVIVEQPWPRLELISLPPQPTSGRPFLRSWLRSPWWRLSSQHWGMLSKWVGSVGEQLGSARGSTGTSRDLHCNVAIPCAPPRRFWPSPTRLVLVSCGDALMSCTCCWTFSCRTTSCLIAAPLSPRTSTAWRESQRARGSLSVWAWTGSHTGALSSSSAWCRTCGPSWRPRWHGRGTRRTSPSGWRRAGARGCTGPPWQLTPTSAQPGSSGPSSTNCSSSSELPGPTVPCCGWPGSDWHGFLLGTYETWSSRLSDLTYRPEEGTTQFCSASLWFLSPDIL